MIKKKDIPFVLGSFAFRYAIGFEGFKPQRPMNAINFLTESHNLGFKGVQLCENLNYMNLSDEEIYAIKKRAEELGLFIEIGMKNLNLQTLKKHLDIAEKLSSNFIRIVLGNNLEAPEENPRQLTDKSMAVIKEVLPYLEEHNITIGIENHFDVPTEELVRFVKEVNSKYVGLIFDSTNGIGFVDHPLTTLKMMKPYLVSIHLKDYVMKKVEAGYLMTGTILGQGWLDTEYVLQTVADIESLKSIVLEMTIRREEGKSAAEIINWEAKSIRESMDYLLKVWRCQNGYQRNRTLG